MTKEKKTIESSPAGRPNRMQTPADALAWREIIGEQNYQACLRALADGASVWTFASAEEIEMCTDFDDKEKAGFLRTLKENPEGSAIPFAGYVKRPFKVENMSATERLLNGVKECPSGSGGGEPSH